ncbi:MAG TPA: hypothetical protein VND97_08815 [Beijerinckiaceae bacterium]|nr:hypothetical protein [Beijerinckiaceae bacterium]
MTSLSRKTLSAALASATLTIFFAASAAPASARWRDDDGWGGPAAAGLIGGLALGAIVGSAASAPSYGPVYDEPAYPASCWIERRPIIGRFGQTIGYRRFRVCR